MVVTSTLLMEQQLRDRWPEPNCKEASDDNQHLIMETMLATQSAQDGLYRQRALQQAVAISITTPGMNSGQAFQHFQLDPNAGCAQEVLCQAPKSGRYGKSFHDDRVHDDVLAWSDEMSWLLRFGKKTEIAIDWMPEDAPEIMKQIVTKKHGQNTSHAASAGNTVEQQPDPVSYPWLVSTKPGKKSSRPPTGVYLIEPAHAIAAARACTLASPAGVPTFEGVPGLVFSL